MIMMDNPNNAITRLVTDSERLLKWANRHGTEKQKQIATDFLALTKHVGNLLAVIPGTPPAVEDK